MQDPVNAGDVAEQLEVASQCMCDAYEIESVAAPEFSLADIYAAGLKSLVRLQPRCLEACHCLSSSLTALSLPTVVARWLLTFCLLVSRVAHFLLTLSHILLTFCLLLRRPVSRTR